MRGRLLISRWRRSAGLTALRLIGLTLAALLAAAVPVFVSGAMERVLQQELQANGAPAATLAWAAPDDGDYRARVEGLSALLRGSGFAVTRVDGTAPRAVQVLGASGQVEAGKKYLKLAALPAGLTVAAGRLPAPGKPEVAVAESLLTRSGYSVGTRLRVPQVSGGTGSADVTIVGTVRVPDGSALAELSSLLEGSLLTGTEYWASLDLPAEEANWVAGVPGDRVHAAGVPALSATLRRLPLEAGRTLPGTEVVSTPLDWLDGFARQMAATRAFLLILLTPVYLLVLVFTGAAAGAVVAGRRVEIAVLRSRGATPWRTVGFYLPESLALVGAGSLLALGLALPAVRLMGLSAGFLQLVGRPPLQAALSGQAVMYALGAALAAELVALVPLARATGFTVVTMRQESPVQSAVLGALRIVGEMGLLALVGYGTWRAGGLAGVTGSTGGGAGGAPADPLLWALPPLALAAAGVLFLRLFVLLLRAADRLLNRFLSPALSLAVTVLRDPPARHQALALMLVLTTGMGLYGAAFARTLDRDLVARTQYRIGADATFRTVWESEVLAVGADGQPTALAYREPPYSELRSLPAVAEQTRVQTRRAVSLSSGARSLGKVDLAGVEPVGFGQVARFHPDLTPDPKAALDALALDEQAVLLSAPLAGRLGLKPGDRLTVKQGDAEAPLVVAGIVPYWPGRLPEGGEFVVGSLSYLQDTLGLAPYDVWLRMAPGADLKQTVQTLQDRGVHLSAMTDARAEVAAGRRAPFRMGIYATLSAGFVVALVVMTLTYLLTAGLTLQSRARELGILRAMGMSARQVSLSLYAEQLTVVGGAAAAGLAAGSLAARLYVPAFRRQPGEALLPLQVAGALSDRLSLIIALGILLVAGVAIIAMQMRRLNVSAVIRLGEDG
jgi:putative ABC transport system permease protein